MIIAAANSVATPQCRIGKAAKEKTPRVLRGLCRS